MANRAGQEVSLWFWLAADKVNFAAVFNGAKATPKGIFLTKSPPELKPALNRARHITVARKLYLEGGASPLDCTGARHTYRLQHVHALFSLPSPVLIFTEGMKGYRAE
jgi:hypothetical protein